MFFEHLAAGLFVFSLGGIFVDQNEDYKQELHNREQTCKIVSKDRPDPIKEYDKCMEDYEK